VWENSFEKILCGLAELFLLMGVGAHENFSMRVTGVLEKF
jgi:hypothetical protein